MSKSTRNSGMPWDAEGGTAEALVHGRWRVTFCGTPDLVKFLSAYGLPASTHTITLP